eukprot:5595130-Pyramimonas_sp.AAC.1
MCIRDSPPPPPPPPPLLLPVLLLLRLLLLFPVSCLTALGGDDPLPAREFGQGALTTGNLDRRRRPAGPHST